MPLIKFNNANDDANDDNNSYNDVTGEETVPVDPDDEAASGFTFSTNITFNLPDLHVGVHELTVNFSNEVSWASLPITVRNHFLMEQCIFSIFVSIIPEISFFQCSSMSYKNTP